MHFNTQYYHTLDRGYYTPTGGEAGPMPPPEEKPVYEVKAPTKLGPQEIGTTTNPMENTLNSLVAKIRTGAGKLEFSFIGQGKTNSQQPGPEAFGSAERRDMRDLVEINKVRTSTHASIHGESLAGLGEGGFKSERQQKVLKEIEKAIHFAGEATRGGAVVFHTGEWPRPIDELKEKTGERLFKGYENEDKEAVVYFADERTGQVTDAVNKSQILYEPEFETKKVNGEEYYVDVQGKLIPKDAPVDRLFDRVPKWNPEKTNFKIRTKTWQDFEKDAEEWNKDHPNSKPKNAGDMFLISQTQNKILEAKGNSLYHARAYEERKWERDKLLKALEFYDKLEKNIPVEEQWKILRQRGIGDLAPSEQELPSVFLKRKIKELEDDMRHTHQASSSADARAEEMEKMLVHVKPIAEVGMSKTFDTLAKAGILAMKHTQKNQDHLSEPIFIAPENFMQQQYGSHPDEIRTLVKGARQEMEKRLKREGYSEENAKELAKTHIKATLDIGHMNLWRQFFEPKEGETMEERDKRFNKWMLEETEKLAKEGIVGHIHLTDNFGYDDEHLTPGEGNVPMKEFIEKMEKAGLNDFIAEAGSFNAETIMHDTWALVNSPTGVYATGPGFRKFRQQHFGYTAPPNYIVGGYSPSNEWVFWSEVPLE